MRLGLGQFGQFQGVEIARFEATPARAVHPAGDHVEHLAEPFADGARRVLRNPGARDHHGAAGRCKIPRGALDQVPVDPAPVGQVIQIRAGHQPTQLRDTGREVCAVAPVLAALVEDHLHHRQQQRPVLAGPHRQVHVGLLRGLGAKRIDHHEGGAALLADQRAAPAVGDRLQPVPAAHRWIGADQQEVVAVVDVGDRHHQCRSEHRLGHHMQRVLVDGADGVAVAGADGVHPGVHEDHVRRRVPGWVAVVGADRVGPARVDQGVHPRGDVADRHVPGLLDVGVAHPSHRPQDPARMFYQLIGGAALGAEVMPAVRVVLVGGDLTDLVVLDRHLQAAGGQAVPAEGVHRPRGCCHAAMVPEHCARVRQMRMSTVLIVRCTSARDAFHALRMVSPPSATSVAPVMYEAAGNSSDSVACATSSGSP